MLSKRTHLIMAGFLLLSILFGLFWGYQGGIFIKTSVKEMLQNSKESSQNGTPVKSVTITVQINQQELLFKQLRQFAKENFFAIRIRSLDSFDVIEMWRADVEIHGSFHPDSGELNLGLLRNNFEQKPPQPIPVAVFDDLTIELESFISEVSSAIITERRYRLIITTNKNWRNEELLEKMKVVAEKNSLKNKFSFHPSDDRCLDVEIHGEGFRITASDCERDTIEDFNIDFYLDYHKTPTATSEETLDKSFYELKSLLSNSDNATVNEQP